MLRMGGGRLLKRELGEWAYRETEKAYIRKKNGQILRFRGRGRGQRHVP